MLKPVKSGASLVQKDQRFSSSAAAAGRSSVQKPDASSLLLVSGLMIFNKNHLVEKMKLCIYGPVLRVSRSVDSGCFHNSQQVDIFRTYSSSRCCQRSTAPVNDVNHIRPSASLMVFINLRVVDAARIMYVVISVRR